MDAADVKKGGIAPFVWAGIILVVGFIGFGFFLFHQLSALDDNLQRVAVPAEQVITLKEPGTYVIFHEYRSVMDGRIYSNPEGISGLLVSLSSERTGQEVPLSVPQSTSRYDSGGTSGVSLLEFSVPEPGGYRLRAAYAAGQTGQPAVLSINKDFGMNIVMTVFGAIGILFGSIVVSVVIVAWTIIQRSRASQEGAA